jgi:hypothetical protein
LVKRHKLAVYPSGGYGHRIKGGYSGNSHKTMPNEQMHHDLKEIVKKKMFHIRKSGQKDIITQSSAKFAKANVHQHINKPSDVCDAILSKDGKRTKY